MLGFLLGFSGGSYYQYKKLAPYVNQNWKLSTELWKLESMISLMDNLLVYEEKGVAEKWFYRLRQGAIECNYNPFIVPSSTSSTTTTPPPPSTEAPLALAKPDYEEDYKDEVYEEINKQKEYVKGDTKKDAEDGDYSKNY